MPSYLVTGGFGQLGQSFQSIAKEFENIKLYFTSSNDLNITDSQSIKLLHNKFPFDGIINCAAFTDVDSAEEQKSNALKINVEGLKNIVKFAENENKSIINFSTDFVFDGESSQAYKEESLPNPLTSYGLSKFKGELILSNSFCKSVSVRTSWLFSPYGKNFVKTILSLAKEKYEIKVVEDQWGKPCYAIDLARTVLKLISNNKIYNFPFLHFANKGVCSWKQFADEIIKEIESNTIIKGIPSSDYKTPTKRPKSSILDTMKIEKDLNIEIPFWQESLKRCIQILKNNGEI